MMRVREVCLRGYANALRDLPEAGSCGPHVVVTDDMSSLEEQSISKQLKVLSLLELQRLRKGKKGRASYRTGFFKGISIRHLTRKLA
ncbi:hypothetical protein M9434_002889 [Picochlorum sp. BPE23]|nr:hypothetical protein M9434_002889 [Picochlorum sp. BPE23]